MRPSWLALAALALLLTPAGATAQTASTGLTDPASGPGPRDVVVAQDTTWMGADLVVGNLTVQAPATLRLEGTRLAIQDRVHIEAGATLVAGPHDGKPSWLRATSAVPPTEHEGFWILVDGTLRTQGQPATLVEGLRGTGLNNLFFPGGGIFVNGTASLDDLHLRHGNATISARPASSVTLRRTTIEDMGFLGLGAFAPVTIEDSRLAGSWYGLMGRTACDFHLERTSIDAPGHAAMANGCRLSALDSTLAGGTTAIHAPGAASVELRNTTVLGYRDAGLTTKPLPNEQDPRRTDTARVVVLGGRFEPAAAAPSASAIRLAGAVGDLANVTFVGHREAIQATDGGLVGATTSRFEGYTATAIAVRSGRLAGDVLEGNTFAGAPGSRPVEAQVAVTAALALPDGSLALGPTLAVLDRDGGELSRSSPTLREHAVATFAAYKAGPDGPVYAGPFTYVLSADGATSATGLLDPARPSVLAQAQPVADEPRPTLGAAGAALWFAVAAGVAVAVGLARRRLRKARP